MSSSAARDLQSLFVVQSGIVAWEDPEPIADWRWKTVSICARRLSLLVAILWEIAASRPATLRRIFRFHVTPIPVGLGAMQKQRIVSSLCADPPGFGETNVTVRGQHACVTSELKDPSRVDLGYLTAYRSTSLLETDSSVRSATDLSDALCGTVRDFGGASIAGLLNQSAEWALLRILELESHAVVQLMGRYEVTEPAAQILTIRGIRQLHDVRNLPKEIAKLS